MRVAFTRGSVGPRGKGKEAYPGRVLCKSPTAPLPSHHHSPGPARATDIITRFGYHNDCHSVFPLPLPINSHPVICNTALTLFVVVSQVIRILSISTMLILGHITPAARGSLVKATGARLQCMLKPKKLCD